MIFCTVSVSVLFFSFSGQRSGKWIVCEKATPHGIRADAAQHSAHILNGVLGEWLFHVGVCDLLQLCVKAAEVFLLQAGELVVTQRRENILDVLPVTAIRRMR